MSGLNATHDPSLRSWLPSANHPDTPFPLQNLPFGAFRRRGSPLPARCGVAIGDRLVDVSALADRLHGPAAAAARAGGEPVLNALMAMGPPAASALRAELSRLLSTAQGADRLALEHALIPLDAVEMQLPIRVAGYTDFFASIEHATNAGRLFRPEQPLLPNYAYVPVAYNGRANSLRVSGTPVVRPHGQTRPASPDQAPDFGPTQRLDHEVELAALIGTGSTPGEPVAVGEAWRHVFGFCLLNDWSARDVQAWEYQPLGPFLGKSFATSLSPWVVTAEALAPFRVPAAARTPGAPPPPAPPGRRPRRRLGRAADPLAGQPAKCRHARARPGAAAAVAIERGRPLLDLCADARAPHQQRRLTRHGRRDRLGHRVRPRRWRARQPARTHAQRRVAADAELG